MSCSDGVERQHDPDARHRADDVRSGVAEHRLLAQVEEAGDEHGPMKMPSAAAGSVDAACAIVRPSPSSRSVFTERPGRRSSRLKALVASTRTRRREEEVAVGARQRRGDEQRQAERAGGLEHAAREAARSRPRRGVPRKPRDSPAMTSSTSPSSATPGMNASTSDRSAGKTSSRRQPREQRDRDQRDERGRARSRRRAAPAARRRGSSRAACPPRRVGCAPAARGPTATTSEKTKRQ